MPEPAPSQRLRIVDENGEVADYIGCPRCAEVQLGDVENLQAANRKLLRELKAARRNRAAERAADPARWDILRLIEKWKVETGHPKAISSADRFDLIKARLGEKYTAEHIELAIEGLAKYPYVTKDGRSMTGTKKERHDRLGIALASGESLERFAVMGHEARKA